MGVFSNVKFNQQAKSTVLKMLREADQLDAEEFQEDFYEDVLIDLLLGAYLPSM